MWVMGMLGNDQSLKMLGEAFKKDEIELVNRDFITWEEIVEFLCQGNKVDALIVVERLSLVDGREKVINEIRAVDPEIRIIWFFISAQKDAGFENWCFKQRVYDFFYPEADKGFNISAITACIKKGRITLKETEPEPRHDRDSNFKRIFGKYGSAKMGSGGEGRSGSGKRKGIIDKPVEVIREVIKEVVVEKPVEIIKEVPVEKSSGEPLIIEKPVEVIKEVFIKAPIVRGLVSVAVYALTGGAGATSMVVSLAEYLSEFGKTAAIGIDGSNDLSYVKGKADYFVLPKDDEIAGAMYELTQNQYQFIVGDYGNLFDIFNNGSLNLERMQTKKSLLPEFFRSNFKIGLGFSAPWHIGKLKFFMEHDMFSGKLDDGSYLFIFDDEVQKIKKRFGFSQIYNRNEFKTEKILEKIVPDIVKGHKPRKLFRFGLRQI